MSKDTPIRYTRSSPGEIQVGNIIDLYRSCTLGRWRPLDDRDRMAAIMNESNLFIAAWQGTLLVGLARSLTDWRFSTYLADLAVRESHQRAGIGRELVRLTQAAAPEAFIVLLAAQEAKDYYGRIGFEQNDRAWVLWSNHPVL